MLNYLNIQITNKPNRGKPDMKAPDTNRRQAAQAARQAKRSAAA